MKRERFFITLLVITTLISTACSLTCFECEGVDCDTGGGWKVPCPPENSVCVWYLDRGNSLSKGEFYVAKRQCGASHPVVRPEDRCKRESENFDICMCGEDLCNGDANAPPPSTTASPSKVHKLEVGAEVTNETVVNDDWVR